MLTKQKHPYFKHPKYNQINKIYETRKSQTSQKIIELIKENPNISTQEMADYIGIDRRNIARQIKKLQDKTKSLITGKQVEGREFIIDDELNELNTTIEEVNKELKGEVNKGDVNKDVSLNRFFSVSSPI